MKRRDFLKLISVAVVAPSLPGAGLTQAKIDALIAVIRSLPDNDSTQLHNLAEFQVKTKEI